MHKQEQIPAIQFFGMPLDVTDDPLKIKFKLSLTEDRCLRRLKFETPYHGMKAYLKDLFEKDHFRDNGEIMVPSWLTPAPRVEDLASVSSVNYGAFVDSNSCWRYAEIVNRFIDEKVIDGVPAMIAVDHSMTGGMLKALSKRYRPENITVLILDSHFDGISLSARTALLEYVDSGYLGSTAHYGATFSPKRGNVKNIIPESYNCASFLKYILKNEIILPDRLIVLGVSDYPNDLMRREVAVKRYTEEYLEFKRRGVTFITKEYIDKIGIEKVMALLVNEIIKTEYIYISIDADVGALNSIYAARCLNCVGLSKRQIHLIADKLGSALEEKLALIGIDVSEIEIFLAGIQLRNGNKDYSLETLSDFLRLLFRYREKRVKQAASNKEVK